MDDSMKSNDVYNTQQTDTESTNAILQQQIASIQEQLLTLQSSMNNLSARIVTKDDVKDVVAAKEQSFAEQLEIEEEIVATSADYAKQLVTLLEQAAIKYVDEKNKRKELDKQIKNDFMKIDKLEKQLSQEKDSNLKLIQIGKQLKAELQVKNDEIVKIALQNKNLQFEKQLLESELAAREAEKEKWKKEAQDLEDFIRQNRQNTNEKQSSIEE